MDGAGRGVDGVCIGAAKRPFVVAMVAVDKVRKSVGRDPVGQEIQVR